MTEILCSSLTPNSEEKFLVDNPDILLRTIQEKVDGVFGLGYSSHEGRVYFTKRYDYQYERVIELPYLAGPRNFEILGGGYAKDDIFVYYEGRVLEGVCPETFESLSVLDIEGCDNLHAPSGVFADWSGGMVVVNGESLAGVKPHNLGYSPRLSVWSDGFVTIRQNGIVGQLTRDERELFTSGIKYYGLPSKRVLKEMERKYVRECRRELAKLV